MIRLGTGRLPIRSSRQLNQIIEPRLLKPPPPTTRGICNTMLVRIHARGGTTNIPHFAEYYKCRKIFTRGIIDLILILTAI